MSVESAEPAQSAVFAPKVPQTFIGFSHVGSGLGVDDQPLFDLLTAKISVGELTFENSLATTWLTHLDRQTGSLLSAR